MFKIIPKKKLDELYFKLDETEQKLVSSRVEVNYLKEKIDDMLQSKDCIAGEYCKHCENSYSIGSPMTPIHCVTYGCKLKIPCGKFKGGK